MNRTNWQPHPDKQFEISVTHAQPQELLQWLDQAKVARDPYARLRVLDRLARELPKNESITHAWMQAMLLANRPGPVWAWLCAQDDAVQESPNGMGLIAAQVAQTMGETSEARRRYIDLVKNHPTSVDVWQKYVEFEQHDALPAGCQSTLEHLANHARTSYEQEKLAFTLSRFWKGADPCRAFSLASKAHALKRARTGRWDSGSFRQRLGNDLIWSPKATGFINTNPRPLFVVGMPRSGTSLLSSILAAHDAIANVGEQNLIPSLAAGPCSRANPDIDSNLIRFICDWYSSATGDIAEGASVTVDKLPANAELCGLILTLFPDAIIVHIERSLADCGTSIHMHDFEFGCQYADSATDLREYAHGLMSHLQHWRQALPSRFFRISFEELVDEPQHTLAPILSALRLEWQEKMLDFWKKDQAIATYSEGQVRKPLNNDGVGISNRYLPEARSFLEKLTAPASVA